MISFAYWDHTSEAPPRQAELVSLWHRECIAEGNTPRLLTARDIPKGKSGEPLPLLALRAKKGKILFDLLILRHRL